MPKNADATVKEIFKPKHQINFTKSCILRDWVSEKNISKLCAWPRHPKIEKKFECGGVF